MNILSCMFYYLHPSNIILRLIIFLPETVAELLEVFYFVQQSCTTFLFSFFFFLVTAWILSYILLQHVSVMYTAQYPVRLRYVWLKKQNGVDICLGQNQETDDWPGFYDTIWLSICHFSHLSHFISMQQKSDICFQLVFLKMSPSVHTNTQTLWFYRFTSAARHDVKLWHFIKENI